MGKIERQNIMSEAAFIPYKPLESISTFHHYTET